MEQLQLPAKAVKKIYFYGAGCSSEKHQHILSSILKDLFASAEVQVASDLMAAIRATCGTDAGIACILGTGMNSAAFDGEEIIDQIPSLGFLLGDEGSGARLGRELIAHIFYRDAPEHLRNAFITEFGDAEAVKSEIYGSAAPNKKTAAYSRFCFAHLHEPFIDSLVNSSLEEFIDRILSKYFMGGQPPVHFVGSIAFHYQENLKRILSEKGFQLGKILKNPTEELIKFHTR